MFEKVCTGILTVGMTAMFGAIAIDHISEIKAHKAEYELAKKQIEALEKNIEAVDLVQAEIKKETNKSTKSK